MAGFGEVHLGGRDSAWLCPLPLLSGAREQGQGSSLTFLGRQSLSPLFLIC